MDSRQILSEFRNPDQKEALKAPGLAVNVGQDRPGVRF
jgi:hypothetical protein